jgi:hypothetical protein
MALAAQIGGHLAPPVHAFGSADRGPQRVGQPGIGHRTRRWFLGFPVAVRAWGDLHTLLSQHPADRLDPKPSQHLIDEPADQRRRGSSSRAKKAEAALRISLVI